MVLKSRKLFVWLISLGVVLAVYLLYSRISRTPPINVNAQTEFAAGIADSNAGQWNSQIGTLGEVGVGTVRTAKFMDFNKDKTVSREFGFEKLLHKTGDEWEIQKPYMNVFRPGFNCYITADKGKVIVEGVLGRPSPKDATLMGNVVIHILPDGSSDIQESFVYLDDIIFVSDESRFSTVGPVKFVSQNARMLGRGLEIIYNGQLGRLEFLRIIHLESLHLKSSQPTFFPPAKSSAETIAADNLQKPKTSSAKGKEVVEQSTGESYRCIFSENVVVDAPQQLVLADEIFINNIIQSQASAGTSGQAGHSGLEGKKTASQVSRQTAASRHNEPNEPAPELFDIVITCDNGILVTPMDSGRSPEDFAKTDTDNKKLPQISDTDSRARLTAQRIDYYPAAEQIVMQGDCFCSMVERAGAIRQKYTLSAPRIKADLLSGRTSRPSDLGLDIEHLTANGGVVKLETYKTSGQQMLGGVKLKCYRFDYDTAEQMFLAAGPGLIALDNTKIAEPQMQAGKLSLKRPCYAVVRNFQSLKYSLKSNRIIADNSAERMLIDYIPVVQGQYGRQIMATAGHIEAQLTETGDGKNELSTLRATGGISYEEETVDFEGSQMFYDAGESIITAQGSETQACLLNGALVDGLEHNLVTGRTKVGQIIGGTLHTK